MRLLILSPFLPYPPEDGGRQRVFEIARRLARRHDVSLLALAWPDQGHGRSLQALRSAGIDVELVPHHTSTPRTLVRAVRLHRSLYAARYDAPAMHAAVARRLSGEPAPDVVQCESSYMAGYRPAADRRPWMLVEHNVEYLITRSMARHRGSLYRAYARREARLRRREELTACRAADRVVVVSDVDARVLRDELPSLQPIVAPNGVDVDRIRPLPARADAASAVFVGKMDYAPNVDAVRWFAERILPLIRRAIPGFTFTIVGGSPPSSVQRLAAVDGVTVTGRVPSVLPYLDRSAVAVVPLRAGSGTRLKVLEAMAAGRAVVSTSLGAEGIAVRDGVHLLLADTETALAEAVVGLARDPGARRRLEQAARRLVEDCYGWDAIAETMERVHLGLLREYEAA